MSAPDAPHCYARRRLHPFRGVTEVMECTTGRCLSADGHNWRLELRLDTGDGNHHHLWYGVWSPSEGLGRLRLPPPLEHTPLEEMAQRLIGELQRHLDALPFPLADHLERWVLDPRDGRPLALIASTTREEELADYRDQRWRALRLEDLAHPLRDNRLRSENYRAAGIDAAEVEALVRERAGSWPLAQWFRRQADGSGLGLPHRAPPRWRERELPPKAFPKFLLDHEWGERDRARRVDAYLAWLAPFLLALQHLSDRTRAALEEAARRNALAVSETWRLYPKVIDPQRITAARVEARLREAQ